MKKILITALFASSFSLYAELVPLKLEPGNLTLDDALSRSASVKEKANETRKEVTFLQEPKRREKCDENVLEYEIKKIFFI